MLDGQPVAVPGHKISIKPAKNGTRYVYHVEHIFRNAQGKPTHKDVLIGKLVPGTKLMIPNKNYNIYYPDVQTYINDKNNSNLI
jgi:hypothetical protein